MAKELPYFRFTAFEWLNDDINLERYELKGLFIDICSYYWFKDCVLNLTMLEKKFSNAKAMIHELLDLNIIKLIDSDIIEIRFLNIQYDLLSEKRKKRQEAGRKGGLSKAKNNCSNAKAMQQQKGSYKDNNKDNNKYNNKYNNKKYPDWFEKELIEVYNEFLKFRKEIKKTITQSQESRFIEKLKKLSNSNPETASKILIQSIENGWQGIFELKNNFVNKNINNFTHLDEIKVTEIQKNPNRMSFE